MLYALDRSLLKRLRRSDLVFEFRGAEMLWARFRTDLDIVKAILPKPLAPAEEPLASAFVARYPNTNFGVTYSEGALFLRATYKEEPGWYCLAMPVDNDMAMVGGREQFGYPKKIAEEITLTRIDNHAVGRVVRRGVEVLHIEAELIDPVEDSALDAIGPVVKRSGRQTLSKSRLLQFQVLPEPGWARLRLHTQTDAGGCAVPSTRRSHQRHRQTGSGVLAVRPARRHPRPRSDERRLRHVGQRHASGSSRRPCWQPAQLRPTRHVQGGLRRLGTRPGRATTASQPP